VIAALARGWSEGENEHWSTSEASMAVGLECAAAILFAVVSADDWQLRGRVVDEAGQPVPGATVGYFWSGNGNWMRKDGTLLDVSKPDELRETWSHVGEMSPVGKLGTKTTADGVFALTLPRRYHTVMAMDRERRRAGILRIAKGQEELPAEVKLLPAVRLRGKFETAGGGNPPAWTYTLASLPDEATRPTDTFKLAFCGSWDARFELLLPPGKYTLHAYGETDTKTDLIDLSMSPDREVMLQRDVPVSDLGTLKLVQREISGREKWMVEAKNEGKWGDYTTHYGQPPPNWHIKDARGVSKDVQLADFRGKWVLVYLWGLPCTSCLLDTLPKLTEFYEEHASQRDRFEILALCTDCDNGFQSLADLDRGLEPIVKEAWKGKTLPFPVLFDPSFETMKRYGVLGYGTLLLIDPNGNLVEGDDQTLAERLKR
jgi:peroxiredoxin